MAIPVVIDSVRINQATQTRVVLLREQQSDRYLLIHMGQSEAAAISSILTGETTSRPMTHDAWVTTLDQLGGIVTGAQISSLDGTVFHATLHVQQGQRTLEFDIRPSDAIALAVRTRAPLFAEEHVLDQAGLRLHPPAGAPPDADADA